MEKDEVWERARGQIAIGNVVRGRVTAVRPFGVFVRLEAGPEALLLVPHFAGANRKRYPDDYPKLGEQVRVRVGVINDAQKKVGLTQQNPDPRIDG